MLLILTIFLTNPPITCCIDQMSQEWDGWFVSSEYIHGTWSDYENLITKVLLFKGHKSTERFSQT